LYPFGHGLSYTTFAYDGLRIDRTEVAPGDAIEVGATVRNTGARAGDEVVQLYVRHLEPKLPQPIRALRGVARVPLRAGAEQRVTFRLTPSSDFAHYDVERKAYAVEPGRYAIELGASSADLRLSGEGGGGPYPPAALRPRRGRPAWAGRRGPTAAGG